MMQSRNPYQTPSADMSAVDNGAFDETSVFSPSGRFGRLSYIAWVMIVGVIGNLVTGIFGGNASVSPGMGGVVLAAIAFVSLATLVLYVIFSIRRCHDFNGSGWLVLLGLIPLVNVIFFLFLWLKSGNEGGNDYAPPRVTAGWERVFGILGIILLVVMLVGVIAAIAVPSYMEYVTRVNTVSN